MKVHTTQKYIRALYGPRVFSVGYCGAWHLLRGLDPFAYNAGIYGGNCDYYHAGDIVICTGYRPHGRECREITGQYEKLAMAVYENRNLSWDETNAQIAAIRDQWIAELMQL
jgi:hypothetical protein